MKRACKSLRIGAALSILVAGSLIIDPLLGLQSADSADNGTQAQAAQKSPPVNEMGTTSISEMVRVWLKIPALRHSNIGLEIMELPSGRVLYSYNGERRFTPASTVKAITCACALDTLSANYKYRTMVVAEGKLNGGRLDGYLSIVPSQDPSFDRSDLVGLMNTAYSRATELGGAPLKTIDGQVRTSQTESGAPHFPSSWLVEDWGRYWMPVTSDLVVDRNITSTGQLPAGYKPLKARTAHGALFDRTLSAKFGPSWLHLDPSRKIVRVYSSNHPEAAQGQALVISNPDQFNTALAQSMLTQRGVKVTGRTWKLDGSDRVYQLSDHYSQPITEIIKRTLHKSDNLYAQQLLRTLGTEFIKSRKGTLPSSYQGTPIALEERGLQYLSQWLNKIGVSATDTVLFDGCGLSRKNGVSPHALNMVLKHMAGEKVNGTYLGLLKANDESSVGKGVYRYKTGTMDTVRAISGQLTTAGGQQLAVTIMANSHTPSIRSLKIAQNALINQLRVIKQIGKAEPPIESGSAGDPAVTVATKERIVVDQKLLSKSPAPARRGSRSKKRRRH